MPKYLQEKTASAIYDNAPAGNPFLAAMPDMLDPSGFMNAISSAPAMPHNLPGMTAEERRRCIPRLSTLFVPMAYMYHIYDTLYRAIQATYTSRTVLQSVRNINALFNGRETEAYSTQPESGSILGVPGIGKTSTIRRCLDTMPQVIEHLEYQGKPFYCKQVLYLPVECPSDCSVKTLAFNLISALDQAIGSNYLNTLSCLRSIATSAIATQVKILCVTHHVGLILIDEIQNAVVTARKNKQMKPLIRFLVEFTNDTSTGIYFVGTPLAEELFLSEEHLKRRTRGIRLLPMKPDSAYREFLERLWRYQFTVEMAPLTDKLANKLYDYSGGIPAYVMKIFQESQAQALLQGRSRIDEKIMQRAIDILAIRVPKVYAGGTYISDFEVAETVRIPEHAIEEELQEVPRLYANKRGRKSVQRDDADLLMAFKGKKDMLRHLQEHDLLEPLFEREESNHGK